ncbi:hypothetical protein [Marinibacterium sp. SX1]|uniref:hypothetical protein n=1 Tax=Marinibacterium sp. SX1 TaxID=3388424 RepID=UPI003D17852F
MPTSFQTDDSAIAISLFRDLATGQWFVARMDLSFGNVMHQMRFKSASPLEQTFCAPFVEMLVKYLPRRPDPTVLADSGVTFSLSRVVLSGLRVIATRVMDGYQTVVVRFARALGALTTLLEPQYRPDQNIDMPTQLGDAAGGSALSGNPAEDLHQGGAASGPLDDRPVEATLPLRPPGTARRH